MKNPCINTMQGNTKGNTSRLYLLLWLCMYFFLPSLIMVFFSQSSLSVGMFVVAILLHIVFLKYSVINIKVITFSFILIIFSLVSTFTSPDMKPLISAIALVVIYTGVIKLIMYSQTVSECDGKKVIVWLYYLFIIIGTLSIIANIKIGNYTNKNYPVFPFSEPSHYALAYAPIAICYQMINSKSIIRSFKAIIITVMLGTLYPNLTLVLVAVLQFFLMPKKVFMPIMGIFTVCFSLYLIQAGTNGVDYFYYRIFFDYSNLNLSNLVYLQGWEASWIALQETYTVGLGFQQNGTQGVGFFTELINQINKGELNRLDGGFLASKLISEAGILGVIFILILVAQCLRVFFIKKKYNYSYQTLLFFALLASVMIELFFRGYGYFSPTFIMLLAYQSSNNYYLLQSKE